MPRLFRIMLLLLCWTLPAAAAEQDAPAAGAPSYGVIDRDC